MSKLRVMAWMVWVIASLFYAYQYILRVMPSVMLEDIMQQFQIGATTMGQFSGIYYIGYSLMHLPLGLMLDRFGPKKVMTGCVLLTVIGLLPLIYADYWAYPILGRALIGMGSSGAVLGLFKIIRMTFAEARFSRMLSFSVTIGLLGAIYGGGPLSYMRATWGFYAVVEVFAGLGLVLAAITYWLVPTMPTSEQSSLKADLKEVFGNSKVIGSCIFAGLMVGPLEGFSDVWGPVFLKKVYGFESGIAASLPSMMFIGMCVGGPLLSVIAEKTGSYLGTIMSAGVLMTACFSLLLVTHLNVTEVGVNFLLVGIGSAYQILAIYNASTYVSERVAGLTTAVANMIIMIFGYAFHTTIGATIHAAGGANSPNALILGVSVIPGALTLGVLGFVYLFKQARAREIVAIDK